METSEMLAQRGARYGKFVDHAKIAQELKVVMQQSGGWGRLTADQAESLEMIAHKIARVLNGDPNYSDNWIDIAGYATLITKRLSGELL